MPGAGDETGCASAAPGRRRSGRAIRGRAPVDGQAVAADNGQLAERVELARRPDGGARWLAARHAHDDRLAPERIGQAHEAIGDGLRTAEESIRRSRRTRRAGVRTERARAGEARGAICHANWPGGREARRPGPQESRRRARVALMAALLYRDEMDEPSARRLLAARWPRSTLIRPRWRWGVLADEGRWGGGNFTRDPGASGRESQSFAPASRRPCASARDDGRRARALARSTSEALRGTPETLAHWPISTYRWAHSGGQGDRAEPQGTRARADGASYRALETLVTGHRAQDSGGPLPRHEFMAK